MEFSRQEYWSGLPCPPPGDHPDPGIEPESPVCPSLQEDSLPLSQQNIINELNFNEKIQKEKKRYKTFPWFQKFP